MPDLRKQLEAAAGQGDSAPQKNLRDLSGRGTQQANVAELLDKVTHGFSRAGYHLLIKNEAWLREGGITAQEYIETPEGTRFRGALLIRVSRGSIRAEVTLSDSDPARFRIALRTDQPPEVVERIDRTIIAKLREAVDTAAEEQLTYTLRILL
jgi:hypothetical protein